MQVFKEIEPLKQYLQRCKKEGKSIGLVPTMGALHRGHIALIEAAHATCDITVCSLFVNPTQFNNPTDLEKYPRTLESDTQMLTDAQCDVLFAPEVITMYQQPSTIRFDFAELGQVLEGKFRPGHFSGVATIVTKLFHIVDPDHAFFGQKDYQQLQIITQLARQLNFNLEIHSVTTWREPDGLAMSSRNVRLSLSQRKNAPLIFAALNEARTQLLSGTPWPRVKSDAVNRLNAQPEFEVEYFELADRDSLAPNTDTNISNSILLAACYVGGVRLIDNLLI